MLTWLRRIALLIIFLSLLITNVLTLTSTAFNAALTGLVATAIGVTTVTSKLHAKVAAQKSSVRNMGKRLTSRSKRIAAFSVAEIPASVIPFAGMALIATGTAWELAELCAGLFELEELYGELEIMDAVEPGTVQLICHPQLLF